MHSDLIIKRAEDYAARLGIRRYQDWQKSSDECWDVYAIFKAQLSDVAVDANDYEHGIKGIVEALKL